MDIGAMPKDWNTTTMMASDKLFITGLHSEPQEEQELPDGPDIFYVCKKTLENLKVKLKKKENIVQHEVNQLASPETFADDEIVVPVDMRGFGKVYDDVEQMVEKLGNKGTVEAFVKAADYFNANHDKEPENERPKPMTVAELRKVLEEDQDEELEEEFFEGEEEEELLEEGEEPEEEDEESQLQKKPRHSET